MKNEKSVDTSLCSEELADFPLSLMFMFESAWNASSLLFIAIPVLTSPCLFYKEEAEMLR